MGSRLLLSHSSSRASQLLLVLVVVGVSVYLTGRLEAQPGQMPQIAPPVAQITLHGSTPAMAWSPDSQRVVVNAAYEYYGYDAQIQANQAQLGIYVVDVASKASIHVFTGQGYHPFWLNKSTVGWAHSEYEDGPPGIFLAQVTQGSQPQKVGPFRGAHRTLLARGGQILAYIGFPEYHRWVTVDPQTGQFTKIPALGRVSSWSDPSGHYHDQCLQRAGQAQLASGGYQPNQISTGRSPSPSGAVIVQRGRQSAALTTSALLSYSGDGGSGTLRPCLSPDGRHVAFFTPAGGNGDYALTISRVP